MDIKKIFNDFLLGERPTEINLDEIRVACAALLVHCARADGTTTNEETQSLKNILVEKFGLTSAEVDALIVEAQHQEENAIDLHGFTRILHANLDRQERIRMVQFMWEVTGADGVIDNTERSLVSLIAQLLDVEVNDAVAARHTAQLKQSEG